MTTSLISLEQACERLSKGQLVVVPTETVYGLAGDALYPSAIKNIYSVKKRPAKNPLIVHYACVEDVKKDVVWTQEAEILAHAFWPGPLTLVLQRSTQCCISELASSGYSSLAVRVPAHPIFHQLLTYYPHPLAAPSANPSGKLSPTRQQHIHRFFDDLFLLEGDLCLHGIESTIVDARCSALLLRAGAIACSDIEHLLGYALSKGVMQEAPGMMDSHYCPIKPLRIDVKAVLPTEGLLAFGPPLQGAQEVVQLSLERDLVKAAHLFFEALHRLDQGSCESIAVMPIPNEGLGHTLNDRLHRASYKKALS